MKPEGKKKKRSRKKKVQRTVAPQKRGRFPQCVPTRGYAHCSLAKQQATFRVAFILARMFASHNHIVRSEVGDPRASWRRKVLRILERDDKINLF